VCHLKPGKECCVRNWERFSHLWNCGSGQCTSNREDPRATAGGRRSKASSWEGEATSFNVESPYSTTQCQWGSSFRSHCWKRRLRQDFTYNISCFRIVVFLEWTWVHKKNSANLNLFINLVDTIFVCSTLFSHYFILSPNEWKMRHFGVFIVYPCCTYWNLNIYHAAMCEIMQPQESIIGWSSEVALNVPSKYTNITIVFAYPHK